MTPTEFFDQFPPAAEGADVHASSTWCLRHWAPCPLLHANGMGASVEVMQVWLNRQPATNGKASADELNARLDLGGPVCCQLGDETMYEIWGHWPPKGEQS